MLDKFDYAEPNCPLCDGKDFYYPKAEAPLGTIPVARILEKVDAAFDRNDSREAGRLLVYWRDEAIALKDKRGELSMESELVGYYRKQNDREKGLVSVARALVLTAETGQDTLASGATVYLNCATAYKAFGQAEQGMPLYEKAEEIYKSCIPPTDPRFGGLYNNMALALADLNRFEEAETAYQKALAVMEKAPDGEAECAITYLNLAHMYEVCGKNCEIPSCLEKAYSLLKTPSLPHNGYYAFVLEKCAPSFGYFGREDRYEELKKESEAIYARA